MAANKQSAAASQQNAFQKAVQSRLDASGLDAAKLVADTIGDIIRLAEAERAAHGRLEAFGADPAGDEARRDWNVAEKRLSRRVRSSKGVMDVIGKALGPVENYGSDGQGVAGVVAGMEKEGRPLAEIIVKLQTLQRISGRMKKDEQG